MNAQPDIIIGLDVGTTAVKVATFGVNGGQRGLATVLREYQLEQPAWTHPGRSTSYPRSDDDTLYAGKPERYPGTDEGAGYPVIRYSKGLKMGYRWFQSQAITPLFGFGFGLSYTTFDIAD